MMQVEIDWDNEPNPLVIVYFEEDSNFNAEDLSWVPSRKEVSRIYKAMKRVNAWK